MKIAVDLRSLQSGQFTGVENYTLNLLDALLALDKKNQYILFYNSFSDQLKRGQPSPIDNFQYINTKIIKTRYPNRLLNLALMFKFIKLEKIIGEFDCLLMPNLNQFNINHDAKLALTVHDLSPAVTPEYYDLKRKLWHKLLGFRRAFNRADVIFAVSEYTKRDLVRLYNIPEQKIKVAYPGIDQKIFHPNISDSELRRIRNVYNLPGDYILFLNTIEPRKNLSNVLKAFEMLKNDVELVIVGKKGWKCRAIFNEIKNSKKSAKIRYIGYVSDADKPAIIKLAKMLVYPSFYEGFGFQPLEAMAVGTPTIASNVTALPEILGNASLLVNPYDVDGLRNEIETIMKDENFRNRLIAKGLEQVKKYGWQDTARVVLEELNKF